MTFWDQKGRAAILAAVEAACDTVGKDLDAGRISKILLQD